LYFHLLDVASQWQPSGFDGEFISSTVAGAKSEHSSCVNSVPPVKLAEQVPDFVSATTTVFVFVTIEQIHLYELLQSPVPAE